MYQWYFRLPYFRAQPTVRLHFGGAIHQQQRRVLSAHDARASAFGCLVPWPLPAVMDWQPLGVAVQPVFCKFLAAFFAASPHPPIFVSFGDVGAAKLVNIGGQVKSVVMTSNGNYDRG